MRKSLLPTALALVLVACGEPEPSPVSVPPNGNDAVVAADSIANQDAPTSTPDGAQGSGTSGSRLELRYETITAADGTTLRQPGPLVWDTQFNTRCFFQDVGNESMCVPQGTGVAVSQVLSQRFADSDCTQLAVFAPTCDTPTVAIVLGSFVCNSYDEVGAWQVGPELTGPIFMPGASGCTETPKFEGYRYYSIGAPVQLVSGTRTYSP